jgi:hypothetical protein
MRIKRGTSVSAGSSSLVHIKTFPASARLPSGHVPPDETAAAKFSAIVVLPVSGTPPMMCNLPRASQYFQIQDTGSGAISLARRVMICGGSWLFSARRKISSMVAAGVQASITAALV